MRYIIGRRKLLEAAEETAESKKNILSEDATKILKSIINKLSDKSYSNETIDKTITDLSALKVISSNYDELIKAFDTLSSSIENVESLTKIRKNTKKYLTELGNAIPFETIKNRQLKELIKLLNFTAASDSDWKNIDDYKKRAEQLKDLEKTTSKLNSLVSSKYLDVVDGIAFGKINNLTANLETCKTVIANITSILQTIAAKNNESITRLLKGLSEKNIDISSYTATLYADDNSIISQLENITKNFPDKLCDESFNFTKDEDSSKVVKDFKKLSQEAEIIVNSNEAISNIKTNAETLKDTLLTVSSKNTGNGSETNTTQATTDWKELLDNAADAKNSSDEILTVWNKYFDTWGENANFVKSLGSIFQQELLKLGFSEKLNPFITFIKICISKEIPLTINNYAAIHNAYVYDYINKADLRNLGLLKDANLIFNKDLYSKSPARMLDYLKIQNSIEDKVEVGGINNYFKNTDLGLAKVYSDLNIDQFCFDVFSVDGDPLKLTPTSQAQSLMLNTKLKNLAEINELLVTCFGEGEDSSKLNWDQNTADAAIKGAFKKPQDAVNALKYLAIRYNLNSNLINKYKEVRDAGNSFDLTKTSTFEKFFKHYNVTANNISKIIDDIAKTVGLTDTTK